LRNQLFRKQRHNSELCDIHQPLVRNLEVRNDRQGQKSEGEGQEDSWHWFTRLKSNWLVNPDGSGNIQICAASVSESGIVVHLEGYSFIRVLRITGTDGSTEHRATDDLNMDEFRHIQLSGFSWRIPP